MSEDSQETRCPFSVNHMDLLQKDGKTNAVPVAVMSHSTKFSQDEEFSVMERTGGVRRKGRGDIRQRRRDRLAHLVPSAQPIPWS